MTPTQRAAMEMALDCLEQLQGGCTDSDDGTVEAITVWCPEIVDALRAALAEHPAEQAYPLPDDLYPGSKDWVQGTYADRVGWLHTMYESAKRLNDTLAEQPAEQPVAWMYFDNDGDAIFGHPNGYRPDDAVPVYTAPQPALPPGYKLVPVEQLDEWRQRVNTLAALGTKADRYKVGAELKQSIRDVLSAAPEAPQPAKQPLTQQEVVDGFCKTPHRVQYVCVFDAGVRFAERAHGITGETK